MDEKSISVPVATSSMPTKQKPEVNHHKRRFKHWRCCRKRAGPKDKELLELGCGPDTARPNNKVITAKYNVLTFFPVSFVNQFRYFTNAYFLVIFIIAMIGDTNISSLNWYQSPYEATGFLLSLAVVVCVSMGFDLAYDISRHIEDRKVNQRKARRIRDDNTEELVPWQSLHPGDLVIVEREGKFPADMLFLAARPSPAFHEGEEDFDNAKCYVETSNIDGETNLKVRFVPAIPYQTASELWSEKLYGWTVEYDVAKPALEFSGLMSFIAPGGTPSGSAQPDPEAQTAIKPLPLDFNNLLLRESVLKNTHEVLGVVLYAGVETKGVQSSSATRTKISNAMKLVNRAILIILFVGLIMVLVSAGVSSIMDQDVWYLKNPPPYVFGAFWSAFFTYVILYSNLLPISLVIATTITNFVQAQFVNWDVEMYDASKDRPAKCATLELAQEIGQVSFLFSDKTGTLTRNEMKLVGCTLGLNHAFGLGEKPFDVTASDSSPRELFKDLVRLVQSKTASAHREMARKFLAVLSVCHTVLVEGHGDTRKYNAEGPDEEALVGAVAQLGFVLTKNFRTTIEVESPFMPSAYAPVPDGSHKFELLGLNHFDSTRKRMSVIVRLPNGELELMVKGADSVMFERLAQSVGSEEDLCRARIGEHLDKFAVNGLRTLVIARRTITESELQTYLDAVAHANKQLGEEKTRLIAEAADVVERNLVVLGASAIEDRLQEGVPETLKCLRDAGIKTWVLTGDKVETAINIGYSSGLLTNEMQVVEITTGDSEKNLAALASLSQAIDPRALAELQRQLKRGSRRKLFSPTRRPRGVSIGEEASGEDPFGMGLRTKQAMGHIVENGFHTFTAAYSGGRKAWRSSVKRKPKHSRGDRTRSQDSADGTSALVKFSNAAGATSVTGHTPSNSRAHTPSTSRAHTPSNSRDGSVEKFSFSVGADTSFESNAGNSSSVLFTDTPTAADMSKDESHSVGGSFVGDPLETAPKLVRQTSTVIPPDANFEATHLAMVVSGAALTGLLHDPKVANANGRDDPTAPITDNELKFLSVAKVCKVVIACRVSPRQKALLVRLVRKGVRIGGKEPITLAIGDGANDVAMIQESRVGVGVAGREGSQAVNSADFSIGQFRFLRRLLLVHGRWNYRRIALLVLYIFYAHILPVLVAFAYNFINMWSGTTPFPFVWTIAYSYIVVIPCIVVAMFNRDISAKTAFDYPSIYVSGRANLHMGRFKILEYVFKAVSHAVIVCAFVYAAFAMPTLSYIDLGTMVYWCILLVVLSRLALECYTWTLPSIIIYLLAVIVFPIIEVIIYGSDESINTLWGTTVLFGPLAPYIWCVVFFIMTASIFFDVSLSSGRRTFFPNLIDIVIETDRGYGSKEHSLNDATAALNLLSRPQELPREAVSAAVGTASESIPLAPKYRSAYAQDVPEGQTVAGELKRSTSRFGRFSLRTRRSFTTGSRKDSSKKVAEPENNESGGNVDGFVDPPPILREESQTDREFQLSDV